MRGNIKILKKIGALFLLTFFVSGIGFAEKGTSQSSAGDGLKMAQPADLVVTGIDVPDNIQAGQEVPLKVRLANFGGDDFTRSISFATAAIEFDQTYMLFKISMPRASEEVTQEIRFIFPVSQWYNLTVVADPDNAIRETNENNNRYSRKIWVSGKSLAPKPIKKRRSRCGCGK